MKFCLILMLAFFYTSTAFSAKRVFSCSLDFDSSYGYMISLSDDGKGRLTVEYDEKKYFCDLTMTSFRDLRDGRSGKDLFRLHTQRTQCHPALPKDLNVGLFEEVSLLGKRGSDNNHEYFASLFEGYPPVLCKVSMIDEENFYKLKNIERVPSSHGNRKKKKSKPLHVLKEKIKKYLKK